MLETMVAAGLFALTLMGVLTIMNTQWNVLDKNAERLYVGHVLQSRLEEIRDLTFDELDALPAEIADFEAVLLQDPAWIGAHRLVLRVPLVVLDVCWNEDEPVRIMAFCRGDWEDDLLEATA